MSALPQSFVDAMTGRLPGPAMSAPPRFAPRYLPGKRVPEPLALEVQEVDRRLAEEGIFLSPETLRAYYAEVRRVSWAWLWPHGGSP